MPRFLITSALPYINGVKHLGNLAGSMLPADVYARFLRARGQSVLFICATDEHGTPAELAAQEAGLDITEYCLRQHLIQKELCARFHLSFDYFGRSSSVQNARLTQHFARKLDENGFIGESVTRQVYSVEDHRFLPDRYVIGTCPWCGYQYARGDQCESCARLLDSPDLLNPRSAISGSSNVEIRDTKQLLLLQSKLAEQLRSWVEHHADWPPLVTSIALKWLNEGLKDRSVTRDLQWGVPVDKPGFEGKVFYVWFDAPIEYISATREWSDEDPERRDWQSWWYEAQDVYYVQFMAKDNIPFHAISFPATILGSKEPWKLVDYIKGFHWLTYYGGKFSTSRNRGVFMDQALELLPADYWRYFLVANAPETDDAGFTWQLFKDVIHADLANNFGNFVLRTLKFCNAHFGPQVPVGGSLSADELELVHHLETRIHQYTCDLTDIQLRRAVQQLREIWSLGNDYLNRQLPWKKISSDPDRVACVVRTAINLVRIYIILAQPLIPATCQKLSSHLGLEDAELAWPCGKMESEIQVLTAGRGFSVPEILFAKVSDADLEKWQNRFSGGGGT